jgi:hypothetical protein
LDISSLRDADIAHGYAVEKDLDRLIERRHDPRDGETFLEPSYLESVRRYNAGRGEEHRSEWCDHHQLMARLHAQLADEHREKARQLLEKGDA